MAAEKRSTAATAPARARAVLVLAVPAAALLVSAAGLSSVTATINAQIGHELAEERLHLERVENVQRAAGTARATVLGQWLAPSSQRVAQREEIVEATERLRAAMRELAKVTPLDEVERAASARLLTSAAVLSNQLLQAMIAVDAEAAAGELQLAMDALDAHARAATAVTTDAGSATDARLSVLRERQVVFQASFVLVALAILMIAATLSRRQLRASEEMRRVQDRAARQRAQFFANMSHELRTPLVAIRGFASMIALEPQGGDNSRHAEQIEGQAQDLLAIINNILDAAKLEADRVELAIEDVEVGEVVERCVQRCQGLVGGKAIELTSDVPRGLRARADFVKLQQVLTNLIGNAIKFTERGRVAVRAQAASPVVAIEVTDTGIGIDAAALAHIWEPFHQGAGAIDRRFGGTGLGLSIVRALVERMGGEVTVRSTAGGGSTFRVTLPMSAETSS